MSFATYLQSHLDAMFTSTHTAKTGVWGVYSSGVLFGAGSGDPFTGEQVHTNQYNIIYKTAAFPSLGSGDVIAVDGVNYTVIETGLVDDETASRAILSKED